MANPAAITTFATLKNAIEDHLNRTDVDDEGASAMVIDLCEARLNRLVVHPNRISRNDSFTVDSQYETLPTDFWALKRFALNTSPTQHLEVLTPDEMAYKRQTISASGRPIYVSVVGANFEFLPSPGSSYTGLVVYEAAIPALTVSNTTNWLLDDHPDVYLYGCLAEASVWEQNDERAQFFEARFQRALGELNRQGQRESFGPTPVARAKPFGRYPLRGY